MGVATKPKTTTTPSTPTTSGALPFLMQAVSLDAQQHEVIPEFPGPPQIADQQLQQPQAQVGTSRFQVSPITEERPANLAFDSKGTLLYRVHYEVIAGKTFFYLDPANPTSTTASNNGAGVVPDGGRRHGQQGGHDVGTSSPSPAGSTYTTASESGGPNTIESEPGNYLSASEDPNQILIAAATAAVAQQQQQLQQLQQQQQPQRVQQQQLPQVQPQQPSVPTASVAPVAPVQTLPAASSVETSYMPPVASYPGYSNSAEVTVIPQHAHDHLARVSSSISKFRIALFSSPSVYFQ